MNCVPTTAKSPGLFANLEHPENLDFIYKWKSLGELYLSENLERFEDQTNVTVNYLKNLDPQKTDQNLWGHYNDDIYTIIYLKICQNSTDVNETLDAYGIDCSTYNSKVMNICENGRDIKENYDTFGINCSSK